MKLPEIFSGQDAAMTKQLSSSSLHREAFDLLSEACGLATDALVELPFGDAKQKVLMAFGVEIVAEVAAATRLSLSGNTPGALTILRPAIERCSQLMFVVGDQKYETALYEIGAGFDKVSYQAAISGMGSLGARIAQTHGQISEGAAHATASRLALYITERDGKIYFGPGFLQDDPRISSCLDWSLDSFLILLSTLEKAYSQDSVDCPWRTRYKSIEDRYTKIKQRLGVAVGRSAGAATA